MPICTRPGISNWLRRNGVAALLGAALAFGVGTLCRPLLAQTLKCTCQVFTTGSYDNGSAGSPSIRFNNDATKGFYRFASGVIGISGHVDFGADATYDIGATNRPRDVRVSRNLTTGGVNFLADGAAGAPTLSFTSATTKGFYKFDANGIGISGNLEAGADDTYDFGQTATTRFRNGSFSGIATGAKVQVGAGAGSTSNIRLRSSDLTGWVSTMLGDESALGGTRSTGFQSIPGAVAQPACAAAQRGTFWIVPGGAGVWDSVEVCIKDDLDLYVWHQFIVL